MAEKSANPDPKPNPIPNPNPNPKPHPNPNPTPTPSLGPDLCEDEQHGGELGLEQLHKLGVARAALAWLGLDLGLGPGLQLEVLLLRLAATLAVAEHLETHDWPP